MSDGCLKGFFEKVGCVTVLVIAAALAWYLRADLADMYRRVVTERPAADRDAGVVMGVPGPAALRSAQAREAGLARDDGPAFGVLSPDEVASLIDDRLDPDARRALDSIRVRLGRDRLTLEGQLLTDVFGRDLLGPLAGVIDRREPIRFSGPVELGDSGVLVWSVDQFAVHSIPFPRPAIPGLIDRLTGGSGRTLSIAVPPTVGDVRVRVGGLTLYRRTE
jgi:hypothetical protein